MSKNKILLKCTHCKYMCSHYIKCRDLGELCPQLPCFQNTSGKNTCPLFTVHNTTVLSKCEHGYCENCNTVCDDSCRETAGMCRIMSGRKRYSKRPKMFLNCGTCKYSERSMVVVQSLQCSTAALPHFPPTKLMLEFLGHKVGALSDAINTSLDVEAKRKAVQHHFCFLKLSLVQASSSPLVGPTAQTAVFSSVC